MALGPLVRLTGESDIGARQVVVALPVVALMGWQLRQAYHRTVATPRRETAPPPAGEERQRRVGRARPAD
jgi:hypothetical protein